jgi:hypothetical protein
MAKVKPDRTRFITTRRKLDRRKSNPAAHYPATAISSPFDLDDAAAAH